MDSKKKQVILLGTLAVLALGAGSYYIFGRGDDDYAARARSSQPTGRKVVEAAKDETKSTRKTSTAVTEPAKTTQRKAATSETAAGSQRKKSAMEKTKVAKKQVSPAA